MSLTRSRLRFSYFLAVVQLKGKFFFTFELIQHGLFIDTKMVWLKLHQLLWGHWEGWRTEVHLVRFPNHLGRIECTSHLELLHITPVLRLQPPPLLPLPPPPTDSSSCYCTFSQSQIPLDGVQKETVGAASQPWILTGVRASNQLIANMMFIHNYP